jgi:hypothetical protein
MIHLGQSPLIVDRTGWDSVASEELRQRFPAAVHRPGPAEGGPAIRMVAAPDADESSYRIAAADEVVEVAAGGIPGLLYGVRAVASAVDEGGNLHLQHEAWSPRLAQRMLWTWDHSTIWALDRPGRQEAGFMNPYQRDPEVFAEDYERLVDFASRQRVNGLIVYGLLRDSHGGVAAASALCRYAHRRGVRILAGIGINSYGGIYFEGEHEYNLHSWLRRNPRLAAEGELPRELVLGDFGPVAIPRSEYAVLGCPSKPENIAWHAEGVRWLCDEVGVGGINFEAGDYGTCSCRDCLARRGADGDWAFQDMADSYPRLLDAVGEDRWSVIEVYFDQLLDIEAQRPLATLPATASYQYCMNRSYWRQHRHEITPALRSRLPQPRNVLRTHMGSQWNRQRHAFVADELAGLNDVAAEAGFRGTTIFGEASAAHPPNELNYLAWAASAADADFRWDTFQRREVEPRLGGAEAAARYLALLAEAPTLDRGEAARAVDEATATARAASARDVEWRWLWLAEVLHRREVSAR